MASSNLERWRKKQAEVARSRRNRKMPLLTCIAISGVVVIFVVFYLAFKMFNSKSSREVRPLLRPGIQDEVMMPPRRSPTEPINMDALSDKAAPDLEELLKRLRDALSPFQTQYLKSIGEPVPDCNPIVWTGPTTGFVPGCPMRGCRQFTSLEEAKVACERESDCGGVVHSGGMFEMRSGFKIRGSLVDEQSYVRTSCSRRSTPSDVWDAFRDSIEESLDDPELNLDTSYAPAREDGSIYVSISSYRDNTCRDTLKHLFMRAQNPGLVFVGLVQQNCNVQNCMTGTGWGNTRRWIKQDGPDLDCLEEFCEENPQLCETNIRVLRLSEREAYGPFFSRYLNSKLWRGENIYLQIDAHTEFRQDWDVSVVEQMRATPSYPYSVISNYPPDGLADNDKAWPASKSTSLTPSALCGLTFEDAGGKHHTVRLGQNSRRFDKNVRSDVPHHSAFVAAGFFSAHGKIVDAVPFDPFMPYLFMGEEISLSIRFWTSGFDIYAPSYDFLRHEYVRKESPKFWESVGMVFGNGNMHNGLTDLIIPRVQALVKWKEESESDESVFTLQERYQIGTARTREQFVKIMNIDTENLKQTPPRWCKAGTNYPEL